MEALTAILNCFHKNQVSQTSDSSNLFCDPLCPAHSIFELLVEETLTCDCGSASTHKWDYSTFSHHLYINEVFEEIPESSAQTLLIIDENDLETLIELSNVIKCESRLPEYMKSLLRNTKYPTCPKDCGKPDSIKRLNLLSSPKVFIISLIWKDFRPSLLKVLQVYASIPNCLSLDMVFDCQDSKKYRLKALILYGAGHYVCVVEMESGWVKIDDELSKVLGGWKELVADMVKNCFYPVGLFYELGKERNSFEISPADWIQFEKYVVEGNKSTYYKSEDSEWTCSCGSKNHSIWQVCKDCSQIRSGIKGWSCQSCTFINDIHTYLCEACGTSKPSSLSRCSKCSKLKSSATSPCSCQQTCRKCSGPKNCPTCNTGYECKLCSDFIPKDEVNICFKCKYQSRTSKCDKCNTLIPTSKRICRPCLDSLWQCKSCLNYNFPSSILCEEIRCYGKRPVFDLNSETNHESKGKTVNCFGCGANQSHFGKTCINCAVRCLGDICSRCRFKCRSDLCENCVQMTVKCESCFKNYFFLEGKCPYC